MDRKRENRGISAENRGRPVALMHVGVDDHRPFDRAVKLETPDRHGNIVNHAEALAMVRIRVMESAANVRGPAIFQRAPSRQNRAAGRQPARHNQFLRVRHLHPHFFLVTQVAGFQLVEILLRMNAQNIGIRRRLRRQKILRARDSFSQKLIVNQPVLLRREHVRAKVQVVAVRRR